MNQRNHPAFPCEAQPDREGVPPEHDYVQTGIHSGKFPGMTLRDWFASQAPEPSPERMTTERQIDRNRNPHNEAHKPKIRCDDEIRACLAYRYADAMLAQRAKGGEA